MAESLLLKHLEERRKGLRRLVRAAVFGIARVQVHDRRTSLCRTDSRVRDLLRRDRQVRGHRGGVDRAGDGAGNDDFAGFGHERFLVALLWTAGED